MARLSLGMAPFLRVSFPSCQAGMDPVAGPHSPPPAPACCVPKRMPSTAGQGLLSGGGGRPLLRLTVLYSQDSPARTCVVGSSCLQVCFEHRDFP